MIELKNGDSLELMKDLEDKSIDLILTDPPWGTTYNKWDIKLDSELMFKHFKRLIKDNGAIVVFTQQPYASELIHTARDIFRYEWIWDKIAPTGFLNANRMPLKNHDNVLVFYKHLPTYNPQFTKGTPYRHKGGGSSTNYREFERGITDNPTGKRYPVDIVRFSNSSQTGKFHPTEKPVPIMEYFVKTYTNPGMLVLDPFMGSGNSGVASIRNGCDYIGFELDKEYFTKARARIEENFEKIEGKGTLFEILD